MRDTPLSNCERDFILRAISEKKRLDGRQPYDYRRIKIKFGSERGCCEVELGDTRVLSQVSCEITAPKQTRPSDGVMFVNLELSPMASPAFEVGRMSDFGVEVNRLLERCLKESRCMDTESLCIIAGEKVWQIRVDVTVLNHEGNIIDCASLAAITSLAHFRRPDITVNGSEIIVHPVEEKDPIPLSIHHMPICVSFAFYDQGKYVLVDPSIKEEKVKDGWMVIGMNKHREICTLTVTGEMLLLKDQVLRCSNIAVVKVVEMTELIHKALDNDKQARKKGEKYGFAESVVKEMVTTNEMEADDIDMEDVKGKASAAIKEMNISMEMEQQKDKPVPVQILDKGVGIIGEGGTSKWLTDDKDMEKELTEEQAHKVKDKSCVKVKVTSKVLTQPNLNKNGDTPYSLDSDSEEEETTTLAADDLHLPSRMKSNTKSVETEKETTNSTKNTQHLLSKKKKKKKKT